MAKYRSGFLGNAIGKEANDSVYNFLTVHVFWSSINIMEHIWHQINTWNQIFTIKLLTHLSMMINLMTAKFKFIDQNISLRQRGKTKWVNISFHYLIMRFYCKTVKLWRIFRGSIMDELQILLEPDKEYKKFFLSFR